MKVTERVRNRRGLCSVCDIQQHHGFGCGDRRLIHQSSTAAQDRKDNSNYQRKRIMHIFIFSSCVVGDVGWCEEPGELYRS
jgi:hypothetical protein